MRYIFFHVFHQYRLHFKYYLFLFFELVLCFVLIMLGMNEQIAWNHRKQIVHFQSDAYRSIQMGNGLISQQQMEQLKREFHEDQLIYGNRYSIDFIDQSDQVETLIFVNVNQQFFKMLHIPFQTEKQYYATKQAAHKLNTAKFFFDHEIQQSHQQLQIKDDLFQYQQIDLHQVYPINIYAEMDIDPQNTIYLCYPNLLTWNKDNTPFLQVENDIITQKQLTQYSLYAIDLALEFEDGGESLNAIVRLFGWVGYIALCIVILGCCGMLIVFIQRRRSQYAIAYYLGASQHVLQSQIELELGLLFFMAWLCSIPISTLIGIQVSTTYYPILMDSKVMMFSLLGAIIIPIMIGQLSLFWVKEKNLIQYIRK